MSSSRDGWTLDAQADAFAQLLALSPGDVDAAFREAARLAEGLFPHQLEGVAVLLGRPARPEQTSTIAGSGGRAAARRHCRAGKLAAAKVHSTIDFVTGAVEQGEKVIVFAER